MKLTKVCNSYKILQAFWGWQSSEINWGGTLDIDPNNLSYGQYRSIERVIDACDDDGRYSESLAAKSNVRAPDFRTAIAAGVLLREGEEWILASNCSYGQAKRAKVAPSQIGTSAHQRIFRERADALSEADQEMLYELLCHTVNWRIGPKGSPRVSKNRAGDLGYVTQDIQRLFRQLRPGSPCVENKEFSLPRMMRDWTPKHLRGRKAS